MVWNESIVVGQRNEKIGGLFTFQGEIERPSEGHGGGATNNPN